MSTGGPEVAQDCYWQRVGRLDEIPRRGARTVRIGDLRIAVFRTSEDRVFALEDQCPHRGGPLSQGIVHGQCVTCPLHDWVIDLATGNAKAPDEGGTRSLPVRIERGEILLGIPAGTTATIGTTATTGRAPARGRPAAVS